MQRGVPPEAGLAPDHRVAEEELGELPRGEAQMVAATPKPGQTAMTSDSPPFLDVWEFDRGENLAAALDSPGSAGLNSLHSS